MNKIPTGYKIFVIGILTIFVFIVGKWYGSRAAEQTIDIELPVEEVVPQVIIKVDNVGCVIAEAPTLTYYVQTDTVRVSIECDSDILFNYLPATIIHPQ